MSFCPHTGNVSCSDCRALTEVGVRHALKMEFERRFQLEVYLWKIKRYVLVLHLVIIALAIALGMAASQ